MLEIDIANRQASLPIDPSRLRSAICRVAAGEGIANGVISLAVIDDPAMHCLNREWLAHDEPTDVLSFLMESADGRLEGEVIVSADTAVRCAARYGWSPADELLLYVLHGVLHLTGYDDASPAAARQMRDRERHYLQQFGLQPRYDTESRDREIAIP